MFECRANDDYVSFMWGKIFWAILIVYSLLPLFMILVGVLNTAFLLVNVEMVLPSARR